MLENIKEKFPFWCEDYTQNKYSTCLTDDFDSLLGCAIEKEIKKNGINFFYTFDRLFVVDGHSEKKAIGIDLALASGRCWDNHVTKIHKPETYNPDTANLNAILDIDL